MKTLPKFEAEKAVRAEHTRQHGATKFPARQFDKPAGLIQPFATKEARDEHLKYVSENAETLPF